MAGKPVIYQGATKILQVTTSTDLSSATEIEFRIDSPVQISKTLTGGGVSNVTSTQFDVTIANTDTTNTPAGEYKYQARATIGANVIQGKFQPNKLIIRDSVFVDTDNC